MTDAIQLLIPLLNPNETEALLAALHVSEGQAIKPGDLLYTLETTKSTAEVTATMGTIRKSTGGQTLNITNGIKTAMEIRTVGIIERRTTVKVDEGVGGSARSTHTGLGPAAAVTRASRSGVISIPHSGHRSLLSPFNS